MTEASKKEDAKDYQPPKGSRKVFEAKALANVDSYEATADWIVLRKENEPVAEMFHVAYVKVDDRSDRPRPLTFVFNGGPGASSAYLHMGALGPKRVAFQKDGELLSPPVALQDNQESWLSFTDLVFVDPIGTGFSQKIKDKTKTKEPEKSGEANADKEFYTQKRDLESLGEFIQRYLSVNKRWGSPVFLAGESYGGYRVAKLARQLQEGFGVGVNGAILISPAIELSQLTWDPYSLTRWIHDLPSQTATAIHHSRSSLSDLSALPEVERFACTDYAQFLAANEFSKEDHPIYDKLSKFLGVSSDFVRKRRGRISSFEYVRELLKDEQKVCGLYDGSQTAQDPFPERDIFEGPDPTLFSIERVFSDGVNQQLRQELELESDRTYELINFKVHESWKYEFKPMSNMELNLGSLDDLRYALSLNPQMQVLITHGYFDMITPYFSSQWLVDHMVLPKERLTLKNYHGGHMYYTWESGRLDFTKDADSFFKACLG